MSNISCYGGKLVVPSEKYASAVELHCNSCSVTHAAGYHLISLFFLIFIFYWKFDPKKATVGTSNIFGMCDFVQQLEKAGCICGIHGIIWCRHTPGKHFSPSVEPCQRRGFLNSTLLYLSCAYLQHSKAVVSGMGAPQSKFPEALLYCSVLGDRYLGGAAPL